MCLACACSHGTHGVEVRSGVGLVRAGTSSLIFFFALHTCEGVAIDGVHGEREREEEEEEEDFFESNSYE